MDTAGTGADQPSMSALLSQLLVAFTIEFDNEFEHRMPHRTTRHGSTPGSGPRPWLVSMAMWASCMRHVPEEGVTARELARRAQLTAKGAETVLTRMGKWWGYLTVDRVPAGAPDRTSAADAVVRPTRAGLEAQRVWRPLTAEIETRWQDRFGAGRVDQLRAALDGVVSQLDVALPDFLPIGGLRAQSRKPGEAAAGQPGPGRSGVQGREPELPALMAKVLLAFALDFERDSDLSLGIYTAGGAARLPVAANLLRVVAENGVRAASIPDLTGVARMAIDNWLGSLAEHGYLTVGADPAAGRFRLARLTDRGRQARDVYLRWAGSEATRCRERFGPAAARNLEQAVAQLATGPATDLLWQGIEPYPDGWRAQVRRPATLPWYPVVSARGGFPDGS